jgi:hypothetical protein
MDLISVIGAGFASGITGSLVTLLGIQILGWFSNDSGRAS